LRRTLLLACLGAVTALIGLPSSRADAPRAAAQNYMLRCMGCHGADGEGIAHRIPALRTRLPWFMATPEGRVYLLRVPGASNSALSDAELAAVMNYLAERFGGENPGTGLAPFTAEEVARSRRPALTAVAQERRELIQRLAARGPAPPEEY
jgi:mono/diheme cytochrome c family protein